MNRKGQALVEFVLILPVFLFLIFAVYDFGMIFNKKNSLENDSTDIVLLYKNGSSVSEIEGIYSNLEITINETDGYDNITISDKVKLITPGLNRIMGNPYTITVTRYIPHE